MRRLIFIIIGVVVLGALIVLAYPKAQPAVAPTNMATSQRAMKLSSPAFGENELIPQKYTCDGEAKNPPLEIRDVPSNAKSLALIMWDPDVPTNLMPDGNFDHWVVFNIPPTTTTIPEAVTNIGTPGSGSSKSQQYVGPCPPNGEHRYFFKLYALDDILNLPAGATRSEVESAITNHVIASAQLMARYNRQK